jgi:hypothetical protein
MSKKKRMLVNHLENKNGLMQGSDAQNKLTFALVFPIL